MRSKRLPIRLILAAVAAALGLLMASTPLIGQETVLYSFSGNGKDGNRPFGGLVFDASGNLYGTTLAGGIGDGTVFELLPNQDGSWTERVLHTFSGYLSDGSGPSAGLILDAEGNLYGTTYGGGAARAGTVFELSLEAGGDWKEEILLSFNATDGFGPNAGLTFDAFGNLYGNAFDGGGARCGTVFELKRKAGGGWSKMVYKFNGSDGCAPFGDLIVDSSGNIYGTTSFGGLHNHGTVFQLTPQAGGGWRQAILHSFDPENGVDGDYPRGTLVRSASGALYGTTAYGGHYASGTAFEMKPAGGGLWTESVLHAFDPNGVDGADPLGGLISDAAGNLYGTTSAGGSFNNGIVFELTPEACGGWFEIILNNFNGNPDGSDSTANLVFDSSGNLYGTTYLGGAYDLGTIFMITP
jgi:uncharacterized repeat protein (TIGR03803 family)